MNWFVPPSPHHLARDAMTDIASALDIAPLAERVGSIRSDTCLAGMEGRPSNELVCKRVPPLRGAESARKALVIR